MFCRGLTEAGMVENIDNRRGGGACACTSTDVELERFNISKHLGEPSAIKMGQIHSVLVNFTHTHTHTHNITMVYYSQYGRKH